MSDPTTYGITEGQFVEFFHERPARAVPCETVFQMADALRLSLSTMEGKNIDPWVLGKARDALRKAGLI
jgi:hypothetical protein